MRVVRNKTTESNFGGGSYYVEVDLDGLLVPVNISDLENVKADGETLTALQVWASRHGDDYYEEDDEDYY